MTIDWPAVAGRPWQRADVPRTARTSTSGRPWTSEWDQERVRGRRLADLSHTDLTGLDLIGVRWSVSGTGWPPGTDVDE